MLKIGIFGAENSHAAAFCEFFNGGGEGAEDLRVVAIGGDEAEATDKLVAKWGLERVSHSREFVGKVDAAMITSRNGALHLGYAEPLIKAGIPVFIDKPVTNSKEDARALLALLKENKARVIGGSSVKLVPGTLSLAAKRAELGDDVVGGSVWAPVNMDNPYGGFYFYSAHLVETALTVFGMKPVSATAHKNECGVCAVLSYPGFDVALNFTAGAYQYGATVLAKKAAVTEAILLDGCYEYEAREFVNLVKRGEQPFTYEELAQNVFVLNAVKEAYETGRTVAIEGVIE